MSDESKTLMVSPYSIGSTHDSEPTKTVTVLPYLLGGKDDPHFEDRPLDQTEATCAWFDRQDWEVPGNGGTNDYLFEDHEE